MLETHTRSRRMRCTRVFSTENTDILNANAPKCKGQGTCTHYCRDRGELEDSGTQGPPPPPPPPPSRTQSVDQTVCRLPPPEVDFAGRVAACRRALVAPRTSRWQAGVARGPRCAALSSMAMSALRSISAMRNGFIRRMSSFILSHVDPGSRSGSSDARRTASCHHGSSPGRSCGNEERQRRRQSQSRRPPSVPRQPYAAASATASAAVQRESADRIGPQRSAAPLPLQHPLPEGSKLPPTAPAPVPLRWLSDPSSATYGGNV